VAHVGRRRSGVPLEERALLAAALQSGVSARRMAIVRGRGRAHRHRAPAVLPRIRRSPLAFVRHAPFVLFLAGLPFFCLALADPMSSLSSQQVSYPGRRIAVIMDASLSMLSPFSGQQLKTQSDTAFSNTMAAAEYFVRVRMKGKYRDLIALEQFGNEAYVITPFTTDYENLLLSLKMISDVNEWQRFPAGNDHHESHRRSIFSAFDFLNSSGNIMAIFSDSQDNNVRIGSMSLDQCSKSGRQQGARLHDRTAYAGSSTSCPSGVEEGDRRDGRQVHRAGGNDHAGHREIDAAATGRVECGMRRQAAAVSEIRAAGGDAVDARIGSADEPAGVQDVSVVGGW
jgi:hypothetical protein